MQEGGKMFLKRKILSVFLVVAALLFATSAMADTSVSWLTPANGSTYNVGDAVAPTGQASASGVIGGNGLDLALVIDESGSMGGTAIAQAKAAAIALVNAMPEDTTSVAVIGFDSYSHTYRYLTALNPDKQSVINAINSIGASGGTNIGNGINAATNVLLAGHTDGRAMMQVVLSDGYSSGDPAAAAANAYANNITVHSVGIPGHNTAQMSAIATAGHGVYTNVTSLDDLVALFDGTGGNLVGIYRVVVTLPDGTELELTVDALGNFVLPDWIMELGENEFVVTAYGTDQTQDTDTLTLTGIGVNAPVPEPTTMLLFGLGLLGLAGVGRKKS